MAWLGGVRISEAEATELGSGLHGARWPRTESSASEPVMASAVRKAGGRKAQGSHWGPREVSDQDNWGERLACSPLHLTPLPLGGSHPPPCPLCLLLSQENPHLR